MTVLESDESPLWKYLCLPVCLFGQPKQLAWERQIPSCRAEIMTVQEQMQRPV